MICRNVQNNVKISDLNNKNEYFCCADIVIDDDSDIDTKAINRSNEKDDKTVNSDNISSIQSDEKNEKENYVNSNYNKTTKNSEDYEKSTLCLTNELSNIPRNRLCTFKSFRNSTFKLVVNKKNSSCHLKNSNNSNRFQKAPKNIGKISEETLYINRINKSMMLRKITEIAQRDYTKTNFQKVLPHPIFDSEDYSISEFNSYYYKNNITLTNSLKYEQKTNCSDKQIKNSFPKFDSQTKIDAYEKMLENQLNEIKRIKNEIKIKGNQNNECNIQSLNAAVNRFSNNIKCKEPEHYHRSIMNNSEFQNKFIVTIDDEEKTQNHNLNFNNYLPLFFRYETSKKLKFNMRYSKPMSQAMKSLCVHINRLLTDLIFISPSGMVIKDFDSPESLQLKANDVIRVKSV